MVLAIEILWTIAHKNGVLMDPITQSNQGCASPHLQSFSSSKFYVSMQLKGEETNGLRVALTIRYGAYLKSANCELYP